MKLTVAKDKILFGLQAVQNVVSNRTTLPILSNVLLRATENRLELTATDLDVTIVCTVEATVKKEGATTLPVKKLFGIARELASAELEMEADEKNVCSLTAGPSFFKIKGLGPEEFPPMPTLKEQQQLVLPQEKLKAMLKKTSFAISTDESRYVLNGILLSLKEHKMTMVATDGRRLSLVDEEFDTAVVSQGEFIVPTKAVMELSRLLQDTGEIEIRFAENQAVFTLKDEKAAGILLITKLIEGSYPNYRQVIPNETKERVALNREELLHALKRAEMMTTEKQNSVRLSFTKNNLAITANSPDVGEAHESIAINYKGSNIAVAFNPSYLTDPLTALTGDEVFIELIDELSPGVLKSTTPFLYVVMPMRLN